MRGEDYGPRHMPVSFQPIYILLIRAPQKTYIPLHIIPRYIKNVDTSKKFYTILALDQINRISISSVRLRSRLNFMISRDVKLGNPQFCGSRSRRVCHFRCIPSQVTRVNKVVK